MPPSWPRRQHRPSSPAANAAADDPDPAVLLHLLDGNNTATAALSAASRKSASPAVSSGRKAARLVAACFGRRSEAAEERDDDTLSPAGKAEAAAEAAAPVAASAADADDFRINRRSLSNAGGFNHLAPSLSSPPTPLVLLTTVDVGGGRVESVTVSDGDDVEAAAEAFCAEHSLPAAVAAPLAAHLAENLLAARRARAAARRRTTTEAAAATAAWAAAAGSDRHGPNPILPPPPRSLMAAAGAVAATTTAAEESGALQGKRFDFDSVEEEEEEEKEAAAAAAGSPALALAAAGEEEVGIVTAAVRNEHAMPSGSVATLGERLHVRARRQQQQQHHHHHHHHHDTLQRAPTARRSANRAAAASSNQQRPPSKMTWVSAQLASGRVKGPYESYAHRLYAEGLEAIRARAAAASAAAARREEAELDGATWTPSIRSHQKNRNSSSSGAAAASKSSGSTSNAWERLAATPLRRAAERDRLERLREERLEAEAAECTFAPAVSRGTRRIIAAREEARGVGRAGTSSKARSASLYESLYRDAERRRQRAAQEEEALYAPWSTKKEATTASAPGSNGKARNPPAVALRLLARRARVDARLAAERDAAERRPVDPCTGKPLFAPSVGRPPLDVPANASSLSTSAALSSRSRQRVRPSDTSVGDFLFQQHRAIEERRAEAVARADAALAAASAARAIPKSNEMMARLRGRRFRQIHRYLASGLDEAKHVRSSTTASSAATTPREGGAAAAVPLDALPPLDLAAAAADAALLASMDPEVAADVAAAARLAEAAGVVALSSTSSSSSPALLDAAAFAALMETVVRRSGVPRAYLQPRGGRCSNSGNNANACCDAAASNSHSHRYVVGSRHHARCGGHEAETFAPAILPESVALAEAAGRRPAGVDVVRAMEADAAAAEAHLEKSRERIERQEFSECTFRPRLVAQERPVRGARDPGADAVAAARARTQVGRGMVLPAAGVAARARRRFAGDEEEEERDEVDGEEAKEDGSGRAIQIPSLPFLQKNSQHQRPSSPGVSRFEQLDYELRAAIEEEERKEEDEEGGEEKPAGGAAATSTSTSSTSRNVFNISVSASATGAFLDPTSSSSSFASKPLHESTLEALRALAVEASERRREGEEKERNEEQQHEREIEKLEQQMPPRAKSRGGGWQMAL